MKRCGALFMTALLLSCGNPLHRSDVRPVKLSVGASFSGASRTVVADPSVLAAQISEIQVSLTSKDGYAAPPSQTATAASSWKVSFTVSPGRWDLLAVARNAGGTQIGSGTVTNYEVTAGSTPVLEIPITFGISGQKGSVSFTLSFPSSLGIDYVQGVIAETSTESIPTITSSVGTSSATLSFPNLDGGTHSLVLTFKRGGSGGTIAGIFREKVVVTAGFQSASWVKADGSLATERAFTAEEFYSPEAALGGLVIDGVPYTFNAMTLENELNPIAGLAAAVTFTATESITGQNLEYSWNYGAFVPIGSGLPSPSLATAARNVLRVRVTAPDRSTKTIYTVIFNGIYSDGSYTVAIPGGNLSLTVSGGKAAITDCSGGSDPITIPAEIGGFPVTEIATNAFRDLNESSIVLPSTITTIGNFSFIDSPNLTSITIPASVQSLGAYPFVNCTSLTAIEVDPANTKYKSIDGVLFDITSSMLVEYPGGKADLSYTIPSWVLSLASECAFAYSAHLTSVTIQSPISTIPYLAFLYCPNLTSVVIPASVTAIQNVAFSGCGKLSQVDIYAVNPPSLGSSVFDGNATGRIIRVPAASVTAYQNAWPAYASAIVAGTW